MTIAYLITAYNNFEHLKKLIMALDDVTSEFYIHIDKKSQFDQESFRQDNIFFIKRLKVYWGGWSHQQAILNLMISANKKGYDRYVLISGTDYPIRPNMFLYNALKKDVEYFNLIRGFQSHKPESRLKYYYLEGFDRRNKKSLKTNLFLKIESCIKLIYKKRNYPFEEVYHGSTWWALTDKAITYILSYIESNKEYVKFFKTSWCPEESFIPTILGNSIFNSRCVGNLSYSDWSIKPAPAFLNNSHIQLFKKSKYFESPYGTYVPFFARKFNNESEELINMIEQKLRIK
ncbi:hypothetical protein DI383_02195 [Flavobacteriaceae bacterium LYZ1037]|nr:hypothetical protein DI383_02195 [Flavobacteriaceae bacterium LYZ1037]